MFHVHKIELLTENSHHQTLFLPPIIISLFLLFIYNPNSRVCELLQFDKNDDENATEWEIDAEH
jgi:hypothetical protein